MVRADQGLREVFFNLESLVHADDFSRLTLGGLVEFEEEAERTNGMRAIRMKLIT